MEFPIFMWDTITVILYVKGSIQGSQYDMSLIASAP